MKYPERIGRRGRNPFHSAIATTFAVEFNAFEEIMLPQILASGATNTILVADGRMAAMSLSDGTLLPRQLGRDYEMVNSSGSDGVFHPKILLQLGRRVGRLFVGSANVTASGICGNAEAIYEIECTDEPSAAQDIIRAAWHYLRHLLLDERGAARDGLDWALTRTPWLAGEAGGPIKELEDGSLAGFLAGYPGATGIADRFVDAVGTDQVERLVVVSPYWDDDLQALVDLSSRLAAPMVSVMINRATHQFPMDATRPSYVSFHSLPDKLKGRFAHAKLFIASTADYDHVLIGSANCTMAALSGRSFGRNAEAAAYRRLPRGSAIDVFDLSGALGTTMDPAAIEPPVQMRDIPLADLGRRAAGLFEMEGTVLTWRTAKDFPEGGSVTLKDAPGQELDIIGFDAIAKNAQRSFKLDAEPARLAAFAVVSTAAGFASVNTHISQRSVLRDRRREPASGATARALSDFADADDFDLWMHQSFDLLARADLEDNLKRLEIAAARPRRIPAEKVEVQYRELSYQEFMNSKTPDQRGVGRQDSTLAGTYSDSVRAFLNRMIGIAATSNSRDKDDDWLDNTDEDGDRDEPPANPDEAPAGNPRSAEQKPNKQSQPIDIRKLNSTITSYIASMTADDKTTGSSEVLRLRLWMEMLLYKASHAGDPKLLETNGQENGWPRMAMRIVSAFFMTRNAPVTRLMLAREYAEMPPDFLETWMTVIRLLDVIEAALGPDTREAQIVARAKQLRSVVLATVGLTKEEESSPIGVSITEGIERTLKLRIVSFTKAKRLKPPKTELNAIRRRILT